MCQVFLTAPSQKLVLAAATVTGLAHEKWDVFFYRLAIIELSSYCTLESFASLTEIIRRFEKMRHILEFALRDGFVGC